MKGIWEEKDFGFVVVREFRDEVIIVGRVDDKAFYSFCCRNY